VSFSIIQLHHALELLASNKLAKRDALESKVHNIVAILDLQKTLDVKEVTGSLSNYIYEPDNFPGIIYTLRQDFMSYFCFRKGRYSRS
jgi:TATA-box binding protein (TBP) (component of TFIID and TFIIIB)